MLQQICDVLLLGWFTPLVSWHGQENGRAGESHPSFHPKRVRPLVNSSNPASCEIRDPLVDFQKDFASRSHERLLRFRTVEGNAGKPGLLLRGIEECSQRSELMVSRHHHDDRVLVG